MTGIENHRSTLARVLDHVATAVPGALGSEFRSVYLTGSAALGFVHPVVQDVDLLFIVETPLDNRNLRNLRDCLEAVRVASEDDRTRVVWRIIAGPWKPEPAADQWTIALHGNLMTRAQFTKFVRHLANVAATMFEGGRTLAGEDPPTLVPLAPVTASLQRENVFGLRWLRDLLYSVTACALNVPPLQPVLTEVVQYTTLTGARNLRLLTGHDIPAPVAGVLDQVQRLKEAGVLELPRSLIHDAARALADMEAALPGVSHV